MKDERFVRDKVILYYYQTSNGVWFIGKTLVNTSVFLGVLEKEDKRNCFETIAEFLNNIYKYSFHKADLLIDLVLFFI